MQQEHIYGGKVFQVTLLVFLRILIFEQLSWNLRTLNLSQVIAAINKCDILVQEMVKILFLTLNW